ncbi:MAG: TraB/GumN family protein [Dysgonamonadaceae bacterium]|jgi:uncharacterized protein YbaP (TraB family)|nr:TraB/GumN family protein [Dysgonamonadaceae bacterium]
MKTNKLISILVFIAVTFCLSAQNSTYPTGSLLWKISGKDLTKPSYIMGTFHVMQGEYLDSIAGARKALNESEQVVGEVVMADMAATAMQLMSKMAMPSGTNYHQLYSDDDYQFIDGKLISSLGSGFNQMGMLKPKAIESAVIILFCAKKIPNFNPQNLLDGYVQKEAVEKQKPVLGLELADEQADMLFNSIPLQRQADLLLCFFKHDEQYVQREVDRLFELYRNGNLSALDEIMNKDDFCPSTDEEIALILYNRNNHWMEKLPAIMKEKSSFIAVGAGHLAGEKGLLHQLQKTGYKVEPIK